jgi:hypothetical protein
MESGWLDLEEALKIKPPEVRSVGYVLKETKDYIIWQLISAPIKLIKTLVG